MAVGIVTCRLDACVHRSGFPFVQDGASRLKTAGTRLDNGALYRLKFNRHITGTLGDGSVYAAK